MAQAVQTQTHWGERLRQQSETLSQAAKESVEWIGKSNIQVRTVQGMAGLTGYEPLGRFRAGPIGMANKEDEVFVTVRYKF